MKALVLSDTHGNYRALTRAVELHPDAEVIFFLGDGESEATRFRQKLTPAKRMLLVRGNNDYDYEIPETATITLERSRIFLTHGHRYRVKSSLMALQYAAREQNADVVLFGHTHSALTETADGMLFVNPGTLGRSFLGKPTYAVLNITKDGATATIHTLPDDPGI